MSSRHFLLWVCRKLNDPSNLTRTNGLGRFLELGGLGWVTIFFFYNRSSWVWVIKLQTHQTRPDPSIFNIYFKYIIYLIKNFKKPIVRHFGSYYHILYIYILIFIFKYIFYILFITKLGTHIYFVYK